MAQPSKTNTASDWPAWLQPYARKFAEIAEGTFMNEDGSLKQYDPSLDQSVAALDQSQQDAIDRIIGFANDPNQQAMLDEAGNNLNATLKGQYLDPDSNPWLKETYEDASRALTDEYQSSTSPELMSAALRAKSFGSSAHQEYADRARFGLGENLGDLATSIYGGNYAQERDRQQQAQQLLPTYLQARFAPQQAALDAGGVRQQQEQFERDTGTNNAVRRDQYQRGLLDEYGGVLGAAGGPGSQVVGRNRAGGLGGGSLK